MKLDCNSSKCIPPTQSCHIHSLLSVTPLPNAPIRVYAVNNKSCVTSRITQIAYHIFIVLYHNYSSVLMKAAASYLMNLEDYQILKLTRIVALSFHSRMCSFYSLFLSPITHGRTRHNGNSYFNCGTFFNHYMKG